MGAKTQSPLSFVPVFARKGGEGAESGDELEARIARLLQQAMGFDVSTVGRTALEHAVRSRMNVCGLDDSKSYWERLQTSSKELQELVEAVVVPETWFFRDREAFSALAKLVMEKWLPAHADRALRVISVPCSSGEEPYSIAMALLDAGLPARRLKVDAIDISARALALARRAVYGRNSFRGRDLDFRDRYFRPTKEGHELAATVRERVHFKQGNLLAADLLSVADCYDVVFCRNVLIYFDAPTQERVVKTLRGLLAPDGILFVGPSETFLIRSGGFVSANQPRSFAFRKEGAPAREAYEPHEPHDAPRGKTGPTPRQVKAVPSPAALPQPKKPAADAEAASPAATDLKAAGRLADAGHLKEAAKACEAHLRAHGGSVAAYYLLGLVRGAMGEGWRAADSYRKVIYLEPDHPEALMHLALLAQKSGDDAAARRLQMRARRSNR
jgi:chemotaxis protein methyltransferase WspC